MIRRPLRFETAVGNYTWPRYALEYDATQGLVLAMIDLPGADFAYDQLGDAPATRNVGMHTLRFLLVGEAADLNAEIDEMRRVCYLGARGDLVLADDAGNERRCRARITAMPQITLGTRDRQRAPCVLTFMQLTDFSGEVTNDVANLPTASEDVLVALGGNGIVRSGLLTVQGPFSGLQLTNFSLNVPGTPDPYIFETSRVAASAAGRLEIDLGAYSVRFSADGGALWDDDSGSVIFQPGQVGLFAFRAGDNTIRVEGAAGGLLYWSLAGVWV